MKGAGREKRKDGAMGRPKGSKNKPKDPEAIRAMAEGRPRAPKGAETVAARPKELDFGDEELPKEAEPKGELVPMAEGLEVVKAELVPEENKKLARRGFRYTPEELKAKVVPRDLEGDAEALGRDRPGVRGSV